MSGKKVPKILQLAREAKGLNADPDDDSLLDKLTPNVPGIVKFADHNRTLPWSTEYSTVLIFADVSGFTALCESYSAMEDSGIDKLTKTLNDYLGAIVENLISSEGDVLKFAGDAILAVWRMNNPSEIRATVDKVTQCCLDIQNKYGTWKTDVGITLTVKMGVSTGPMKVTFLGNDEFRVYVETGQAVSDVSVAESFCKSGYVVLSPYAWNLATQSMYETETLHDDSHVRVISKKAGPGSNWRKSWRIISIAAMFTSRQSRTRRMSLPVSSVTPKETVSTASNPNRSFTSEPELPTVSRLKKLRSVVQTVTLMRLDEALRLFILPPVLKKIDDFQPLEYLSEMRQVSIVFINLVLDEDEDETRLLQKIFEVIHTQTKAMHGCLNKVFLFDKGCTFLVIFGLPGYTHEQDCAHALMCSHRMKITLDDFKGVMHVSIGVTTGTTFCGVVGHSKRHEYSVIGRKVNMAARLMMHYPDKVTCDDNTFQLSRLVPHHFDVLITKRMKGLRNVGIIREYIEQSDAFDVGVHSVPYFHYPLLGCAKETELFQEQLKLLKDGDCELQIQHLVYVGASGIGKTRLLNHLIICTEQQQIRVISCAVKMNDSYNPHFLTRHILCMLITSTGFSQHIDREPQIIQSVISKGLLASLIRLMPVIIGTQMSKNSIYYNTDDEDSWDKLTQTHELICTLAEICVSDNTPVVIALDDAQNIDAESWKTLYSLSEIKNILLILTIRPFAVEEPTCPNAAKFFDNSNVYIEDMCGIEDKYLTALSCQLMDVVRIPVLLEKLLKERCHGVPCWCEHVLIDMVEKKQLMILKTVENVEEYTIAPDAKHIQCINYRTEHSSDEYQQCNDAFLPATTLDALVDSKEHTSDNCLKDLGYVSKHGGQKERLLQRIAVISPAVDPGDISVPDIMKHLVTAKIDSMRATEQLIVKCAAVLGERFPRDIIESILPNVNRIKARKSFKVLIKLGIFECGNAGFNQPRVTTEADSGVKCYCPKDEDVDNDLCNLMKFTNLILMKTCYLILMESQRKALHDSAAEYLEKQADKFRKEIPYYILERPPPIQDHMERERNHSKRRGSNKVEDIDIANAESDIRPRNGSKDFQIQDFSLNLPALLQCLKFERTTKEICECLIPIYTQIYHHRKGAKDYRKSFDILVEKAAALIVMKESSRTMEVLEDAEQVINEMKKEGKKNKNKKNLNVLSAKLARLTGKALAISGDTDNAHYYMKRAAKHLKMSEPECCCFTYMAFLFNLMYLKLLRISKKSRNLPTERTVEEGNCLSELYEFEKENGDELNMSVNTLKQMIRVTGTTSNLHQMIKAYKVMIEYCRKYKHPKWKDKLEEEFLDSSLDRHEELQLDDLVMMSDICAGICLTSLHKGDIDRTISSGTTVLEIGDSLKYTDIDICVFPLMTLALMFSDKKEPCLKIIEKLKTYNDSKFSVIGQSWYYAINMEIMLSWDLSRDSLDDILEYACKLMSKPDCVCNEMLPRYMLAMSTSLWYYRHDQWSRAQMWFGYWEMYEPAETTFLSVYVLSRKIEIMLMSLCINQRTKPRQLWELLQKAALKDLKTLSISVKRVVTLKPRYHHLKAYFWALKHNYHMSELELHRALKLANEQDNKLEHGWLEHHREIWYNKETAVRGVNQDRNKELTEDHTFPCSSNRDGYYTWPLETL